MTREHKLVVSLEEIKNLVLECTYSDCNAKVVFSPDKTDSLPEICPHGHIWDWGGRQGTMDSPIAIWVRLLRKLRDSTHSKCGFRILLEFDEPDARP